MSKKIDKINLDFRPYGWYDISRHTTTGGIHISFKANRWSLYRKYRQEIKMSIPNAAIAAGYPQSLVDKHLDSLPVPLKPSNSTDFLTLFEQKQMSDVKKVEMAIAGMNAMKVVSVETDEKTVRGQKIYRNVEVPDWIARHKWFETMLKLCKQLDKTDTTNNNIFVTSPDFANQMRIARERATEEMKAKFVKRPQDSAVDAEFVERPAPLARTTLTEAMAI